MINGGYFSDIDDQIIQDHYEGLMRSIDIYDIPKNDVIGLLFRYCSEVLLSDEILNKIGIIPTIRVICNFIMQQTKEYQQNEVLEAELTRTRRFVQDLLKSLEKGSNERNVLDVLVYFLYGDHAGYDAGMTFLVFYERLFELGQYYQLCECFTEYLITKTESKYFWINKYEKILHNWTKESKDLVDKLVLELVNDGWERGHVYNLLMRKEIISSKISDGAKKYINDVISRITGDCSFESIIRFLVEPENDDALMEYIHGKSWMIKPD